MQCMKFNVNTSENIEYSGMVGKRKTQSKILNILTRCIILPGVPSCPMATRSFAPWTARWPSGKTED